MEIFKRLLGNKKGLVMPEDNASNSDMFPDVSVKLGEDVYYLSPNGYGSVYPAKVINVKGTEDHYSGVGADILVFNDQYPYVHLVTNVIVSDSFGSIRKISK